MTATTSPTEWRDQIVGMIPTLRAFAWSLCQNGSDADDLVQDTLAKAWAARGRFEPGSNLRAWLFTILRNTWYTHATRRRREVSDADGTFAGALRSPPAQEWSLAVNAMRQALDRLPADYREALILVGGAGLSYEEAAQVCDCAVGTIKSRVNRARARLLKELDGGEPGGAMDELRASGRI